MDYNQIVEAKDFILQKISHRPETAIILGSGLSALAEDIEERTVIPYKDIPNFPVSTVEGHAGNLVIGRLNGKDIVCMQGRFHYYEGYTMQQVTFPVRVMQLLGIKTLIVTNAAGGVNKSFVTGDIMLITDHISRMPNPLIGKNDDRLGTRFPSMNEAYDKKLISLAKEIAKQENISLQEGIYVGNPGPSFETKAEYIMYRNLGLSAVGMSTVPEVIVAAHAGMKVLGFSVISNVFNEDVEEEPTHAEVLQNTEKANKNLVRIIKGVVAEV